MEKPDEFCDRVGEAENKLKKRTNNPENSAVKV